MSLQGSTATSCNSMNYDFDTETPTKRLKPNSSSILFSFTAVLCGYRESKGIVTKEVQRLTKEHKVIYKVEHLEQTTHAKMWEQKCRFAGTKSISQLKKELPLCLEAIDIKLEEGSVPHDNDLSTSNVTFQGSNVNDFLTKETEKEHSIGFIIEEMLDIDGGAPRGTNQPADIAMPSTSNGPERNMKDGGSAVRPSTTTFGGNNTSNTDHGNPTPSRIQGRNFSGQEYRHFDEHERSSNASATKSTLDARWKFSGTFECHTGDKALVSLEALITDVAYKENVQYECNKDAFRSKSGKFWQRTYEFSGTGKQNFEEKLRKHLKERRLEGILFTTNDHRGVTGDEKTVNVMFYGIIEEDVKRFLDDVIKTGSMKGIRASEAPVINHVASSPVAPVENIAGPTTASGSTQRKSGDGKMIQANRVQSSGNLDNKTKKRLSAGGPTIPHQRKSVALFNHSLHQDQLAISPSTSGCVNNVSSISKRNDVPNNNQTNDETSSKERYIAQIIESYRSNKFKAGVPQKWPLIAKQLKRYLMRAEKLTTQKELLDHLRNLVDINKFVFEIMQDERSGYNARIKSPRTRKDSLAWVKQFVEHKKDEKAKERLNVVLECWDMQIKLAWEKYGDGSKSISEEV